VKCNSYCKIKIKIFFHITLGCAYSFILKYGSSTIIKVTISRSIALPLLLNYFSCIHEMNVTRGHEASNCDQILALLEGLAYLVFAWGLSYGYLAYNRFGISPSCVWPGSVIFGILFMLGMMWSTLFRYCFVNQIIVTFACI
jgi:vacuolar-type H+-ATPase subunit I/STV1